MEISEGDRLRIHLADTSSERGQYKLLVDEEYSSSLMSYAYKDACGSYFEQYWNALFEKAMERCTNSLWSFAYSTESEREIWKNIWNSLAVKSNFPRVIIDSGAFTAWSTGKQIKPEDYGKWAIEFDKKWRHKFASLYFMNLDVIGDQDATWKNQRKLENMGLTPIPIVTFNVDLKHLDKALAEYDYIALGGLVPYSRNKKVLSKWLDTCFSRVVQYKRKTGILRKIHLLGVTTDWVLKRYPCYSSDSSSWVSCLRFGGAKAAGIDKIPRYKQSDAAMTATIHTLRQEIRKYKRMEEDSTNLWAKRGVIWND